MNMQKSEKFAKYWIVKEYQSQPVIVLQDHTLTMERMVYRTMFMITFLMTSLFYWPKMAVILVLKKNQLLIESQENVG